MKNRILVYFVILFGISTLNAQTKSDSLSLQLHLNFDKKPIQLGENYISKNSDTLAFEVIKFYLSNIQIHYKDKNVFKEKNSYHLIDIEDLNSLKINLDKYTSKEIEKITFNIGIDSTASVSGALGGDLDPTKGMYWAWQSGYINIKIEGKSHSCKTRKNQFQFHIGGYLSPNYAIRPVELNYNRNTSTIVLSVDLATLFSKIQLKESNTIMIPGKEAMKIADYSTLMFQFE